ncbi:MAG: hypothetical protein RL153_855, partial [Verrucomicrobiota bacterium]
FCSRLHPFIWERVKGTLLPVYERP